MSWGHLARRWCGAASRAITKGPGPGFSILISHEQLTDYRPLMKSCYPGPSNRRMRASNLQKPTLNLSTEADHADHLQLDPGDSENGLSRAAVARSASIYGCRLKQTPAGWMQAGFSLSFRSLALASTRPRRSDLCWLPFQETTFFLPPVNSTSTGPDGPSLHRYETTCFVRSAASPPHCDRPSSSHSLTCTILTTTSLTDKSHRK